MRLRHQAGCQSCPGARAGWRDRPQQWWEGGFLDLIPKPLVFFNQIFRKQWRDKYVGWVRVEFVNQAMRLGPENFEVISKAWGRIINAIRFCQPGHQFHM